MFHWTQAQWDAYGRHVGTYVGGIITGLITIGLVTQTDGMALINGLNSIVEGVGKIIAGIGVIAGVAGPIYTAWRAARSASPEKQAEQTVKNINEGVPINGKKEELVQTLVKTDTDALIAAVAAQPEVRKVVVKDPVKAMEIPSDKVTAA